VLLKNEHNILPLDPAKVHSIAVLGVNADTGMISGGGSAQVDPPGRPPAPWQAHVWFPTSPLKAIAAKAPGVVVRYGGSDPADAAQAAKGADVAIVFAYQWESEGMDLPDLSLPDKQDALIERVAAANPHTIVVLETGTAVTMPWLDKVDGVVEVWYAGSNGAKAVANVLFGEVNPSGKLPMTFPRSVADLPHPDLVTPPPGAQGKEAVMRTGEAKPTFSVHYDEGVKVGYKWYDAEHKPVLFPFGYGLSYTSYRYSGLKLGDDHTVTFTVTNTGKRVGSEIAEVYAGLPAAAEEPPKRLVGWARVALKPGESREATVVVDPKYLSIYNEQQGWTLVPGQYTFLVGGSSEDLPLKQETTLK
jgi:beta-glucosidase